MLRWLTLLQKRGLRTRIQAPRCDVQPNMSRCRRCGLWWRRRLNADKQRWECMLGKYGGSGRVSIREGEGEGAGSAGGVSEDAGGGSDWDEGEGLAEGC